MHDYCDYVPYAFTSKEKKDGLKRMFECRHSSMVLI